MATNAQINETQIKDGSISDTQLSPGAGISYNKLNILNSIKNADIASSAAIAYSKLNLAGGIVNSDIANGATITYSKLNLTGGIVNNDIATGASIDAAKIGGGNISNIEFGYLEGVTANIQDQLNVLSGGGGVYNHSIVVVTNALGNLTSSTITTTELGYLYGVTSSIQTQLNAKEATISAGTSSQYWRGDKTWQTLNTSAVAEGTNLYYTDVRADARITAQKGYANGLATLDSSGLIPSAQLPAIAITNTYVVASQAAMLALTAQTGDIAVRSDENKSYVLAGTDPTVLGDWQALLTPTDSVLSVNGQTGSVSLTTTDISEGSNLYYTSTRFNTAFSGKSTTDLSEGTNLYYTNARGIGSTLTGYTSGAGTVSSTDTILQAIQKLNGNSLLLAPLASPSFTGDVSNSGRLVLSGNNSFTAASNNVYLYHSTVNGLVIYGQGSSYDVIVGSYNGSTAFAIPTGTANTQFFGVIQPNTNDACALGTTTSSWSDLFLASGGVINWNNGNYTVTHSAGLLTFSSALTVSGATTHTGTTALQDTVTIAANKQIVSSASTSYNYLDISNASGNLIASSRGSIFLDIDADDNSTSNVLFVRFNGSAYTSIFEEDGSLTLGTTAKTGSYALYSGAISVMNNGRLTVNNTNQSTTLTNFTQSITNSGILINTSYTVNAYTAGLFWATTNDNASLPKAGIFMKETGLGTTIFIGTSNNYAAGITSSISIDQNGSIGVQSVSANTYIALGVTGSTTGYTLFNGSTSGSVTLSVAAAAGTWTMKLPTSAGTSGYFLQTDGSGNTTWAAASGGTSTSATLFTGTATGSFNNVTTTTIVPSGTGSMTMAANYLTAGKTIRIKFNGQFAGSGTGSFIIKIGSTTIMTISSITGVNGYGFTCEATITCNTTGATGTVMAYSNVSAYTSSSGVGFFAGTSSVTIDTTSSQVLDVQTTMSSTLTASIYTFSVEALN